MLRKAVLAGVIAAAVMFAIPVAAQAAPADDSTFAGVYPSTIDCYEAGAQGGSEGRWDTYDCRTDSAGEAELWVGYGGTQPTIG